MDKIRRPLCAILSALLFLTGGCGQKNSSIYSNYQEIENLQLIQTLGIDPAGQGVILSAASGTGTKDIPPVILSATGSSIPSAEEHLQDFAPQRELFYAHTKYILFGEDAAKNGIARHMDYILRSSHVRISAGMFVVIGSDAKTLITNSSGASSDITDALATLESQVKSTGESHIYSCRDIAVNLSQWGSSLACAVAGVPAENNVFPAGGGSSSGSSGEESSSQNGSQSESGNSSSGSDKKLALKAVGYAVLSDGKLKAVIPYPQALGASILTNNPGHGTLSVFDSRGGMAQLKITEGNTDIKESWALDGTVESFDINCKIKACILEMPNTGDISDPEYITALETAAAKNISSWISDVLKLSRELEADFLLLGSGAAFRSPDKFHAIRDSWPQALRSIDFNVSVDFLIEQSFEMQNAISMKGE